MLFLAVGLVYVAFLAKLSLVTSSTPTRARRSMKSKNTENITLAVVVMSEGGVKK